MLSTSTTMDAPDDSVNISPSAAKHVRSSSANSELESCGSSQLSDTSTIPSLSAYSDSVSSLSPFMSPPTTPRSPLVTTNGSRLHRFTSHEHLSSFSNSTPGLKRDWSSTSSLLQDDDDDKFTQLPIPSSRERRSSSLTYSARSRKSLSNLRKPALLNSAGIDEEHSLSNTPKGMMSPQISPLEGNKLSRRHIEASRRSAKEALEEDLRAYDASSTSGDGFVLDCYFSSLDYLIKALKVESDGYIDSKSRRSIRVRLQTLLDSLATPEEQAEEQSKRYQEIAKALQAVTTQSERCQCVATTAYDYLMLFVNLVTSAFLTVIVYIVDSVTSTSESPNKVKAS